MRSLAKLVVLSILTAVAVLAEDPPPAPSVTSEVRPEQVLPPDILTNEGVVLLSNSGFSDAFIAEKIQLSRTRLDTTVEGLTYLRHNSVSEELIRYIMERGAQPPLGSSPTLAPAPATAGPELVPMKVVRKKVLLPRVSSPMLVAIPSTGGLTSMPVPMYSKRASYYGWYFPRATSYGGAGYSQPAYGPTGPSVMSVGAPVVTPYGWVATR